MQCGQVGMQSVFERQYIVSIYSFKILVPIEIACPFHKKVCYRSWYVFSSVKKVEKDDEDERRPKRMLSPTLPDGDLPSYMKATESYFKKV